MKNSNILQLSKVAPPSTAKPTIVITNKQGQQLTNQQIIIVTTGASLRSLPSATVMSNISSSNNLLSIVSSSSSSTTTSMTMPHNVGTSMHPGVKMIRGVTNAAGRPIRLSLPSVQPVHQIQTCQQPKLLSGSMQNKTFTLSGKSVTVQVAGNSGLTGIPKSVTIVAQSNHSQSNALQSGCSSTNKVLMVPNPNTSKSFVNILGSTVASPNQQSKQSLSISSPSNSKAKRLESKDGLVSSFIEKKTERLYDDTIEKLDKDLEENQKIDQLDGALDVIIGFNVKEEFLNDFCQSNKSIYFKVPSQVGNLLYKNHNHLISTKQPSL